MIALEGGGWIGPFGRPVARLVIPGWWREVTAAVADGSQPVDNITTEAGFSFRIGRFVLDYGPYGLERVD